MVYWEDELSQDDCSSDEIDSILKITSPTNHDEQLFEGSNLTVQASSVLLLQYKLRHRLTEEAMGDLLRLIKMHCPSNNKCPASVFQLKKFFPDINYTIKPHHLCSQCMQSVDAGSQTCPNESCNKEMGSPNALSSFIELPIESQLKVVLESKLIIIV